MATYLASEAQYKERTPAASGIQDDQIAPALQLAQEQEIRPLLGDDLYNQLVAQVEADSVTATNQLLLDRIVPYLVWAAHVHLRTWLSAKTVTAGVVSNSAPQYTPINSRTLEWANQKFLNVANQYRDELLRFLNQNASDYPLYTCPQTTHRSPWIASMGGRSTPLS